MIAVVLLCLLLITELHGISINVQGRFTCPFDENLPVLVEMKEWDPVEDDVLEWIVTKSGRHFEIEGTEHELFGIDPYLVIRHKCGGLNERILIHLGRSRSDQAVDLGSMNLADPELKDQLQDKYRP
ncbi:unnamed protein product [Nippostrongylus brasiliensis]|uniref:Transthyretin-like family protein n=1 Tax=Nippostrongylus brasiliensis TaxID=27835 RepID=A0A0N4Y4R1_NIPBR|nr:hypothetical protein Q1695_001143 [Nippostrongylus brasiliensis]VDL74500.1 unnamed protein product [Nippostrongylus brasiliensis]